MKTLLALLLAFSAATPALASDRFCSSSYWVWMGQERVKVCCSNDLCTTKYGVYSSN